MASCAGAGAGAGAAAPRRIHGSVAGCLWKVGFDLESQECWHVSELGLLGLSILVFSPKILLTRIVAVLRQVFFVWPFRRTCNPSHNPSQNPGTILTCLGAANIKIGASFWHRFPIQTSPASGGSEKCYNPSVFARTRIVNPCLCPQSYY